MRPLCGEETKWSNHSSRVQSDVHCEGDEGTQLLHIQTPEAAGPGDDEGTAGTTATHGIQPLKKEIFRDACFW